MHLRKFSPPQTPECSFEFQISYRFYNLTVYFGKNILIVFQNGILLYFLNQCIFHMTTVILWFWFKLTFTFLTDYASATCLMQAILWLRGCTILTIPFTEGKLHLCCSCRGGRPTLVTSARLNTLCT